MSDDLDRMLEYIRKVAVPAVREHGWHVHGHMTSATQLSGNITYTVGLTEAGLPELAMTGLPHEIAAVILNDSARQHLQAEIRPGLQFQSAGGSLLRAVDAPGVIGPLARSMYGAPVRFLQLLWACPHEHFPTEPEWLDDHPQQPVYTTPLPAELLPEGGGVVGHMDEVTQRRDADRPGGPAGRTGNDS